VELALAVVVLQATFWLLPPTLVMHVGYLDVHHILQVAVVVAVVLVLLFQFQIIYVVQPFPHVVLIVLLVHALLALLDFH